MNLYDNYEKIYWWDPTGHSQWMKMEDVDKLEPARCVTVAQVIREDKNFIVTAASHSNVEGCETEFADITIIPKGCVKQRIKMKGAFNAKTK